MLQHLTAISRDETLAPYVNLVPSDLPGDMYALVAEKVWDRLEKQEMRLPAAVYSQFDAVLETVVNLQRDYDLAPAGSEKKILAYEKLQTWRNNNRALREWLFPVYWNRIKDLKLRRKIVKRGTMTLGYGATQYGMGQQINEDSKSLSPYLSQQETLWSVQLGKLLHETCYSELEGPADFLRFFEEIAEQSNEQEEFLSWNSPITNFPVVQNYRKPVTNRTKLRYGDQELYVSVENWDDSTLHKDRQKQGSSPNIIHSLDAVHLTMVVHSAPFKMAVVHDSFGCVAGSMSKLFPLVREKFAELHESDPLSEIINQINPQAIMPKRGKLRLDSILESDYAFA